MTLPSTAQQIQTNLSNIEGKLNQTTPDNDKAFNKILAVEEGMAFTSLLKYAAERARANLVRSAIKDDLDRLGADYRLPRRQAVATQMTLSVPGSDGTIIVAGKIFIGEVNGALYKSTAAATIISGTAAVPVTAQVAGAAGNLTPGDVVNPQSNILGVTGSPTATSIDVTGADAESDGDYQQRILDVQQSQGGGGNASDYRNWGQSVAGVVRCYPFSGPPPGTITWEPPTRTVYVECSTDIDPDGVAPVSLLDQVRAAIEQDADGKDQMPLGITSGTLYVVPIVRTQIYVWISNLVVPVGIAPATVQAAIGAAVDTHLLGITPFCAGLDPAYAQNDTVTNLSLSKIVQAVLVGYGASATNVSFGTSAGVSIGRYQVSQDAAIGQGEKLKLAPENPTYA